MNRHHWAVILAGGAGVRRRSMTRSIAGDDRPSSSARSWKRTRCSPRRRLAVLPVGGVHWNDLGDPERVLATRRRAHAMRMDGLLPVPISA